MTKQAPGASLLLSGAPRSCRMRVPSCWALWVGKFRSPGWIWSAAWVPVLFLGHSFQLVTGSTFLCHFFSAAMPTVWRSSKVFVGDDLTAATPPRQRRAVTWRGRKWGVHSLGCEERSCLAGVLTAIKAKKIGHSASQQVSGCVRKKTEVRAAASLPRLLCAFIVIVVVM